MWRGRTLVAVVIVAIVGPGCAREDARLVEPAEATAEPILQPGLAWYGDNRERLEAMIAENGSASAGYDPQRGDDQESQYAVLEECQENVVVTGVVLPAG